MNNQEEGKIYLLDAVKTCEFTGKKYYAIEMVKCDCECHEPNTTTIHFMACCDGGYIKKRKYLEG